jgi:LmbE family N-acetylglucosaminyl deacetylase
MTLRDLACALAVRVRGLPHRAADQRMRSRIAHDPAAPALILSPHMDDAVLNCWSVLSGPGPVAVVNVFGGIPRDGFVTGWDAVCGATDSAEMVRTRLAEDRQALARIGVEPSVLPFLDAQYRGCRALPAFAAVDAAIASHVPAASMVYVPLGTRHADHRYVRRLGAALVRSGLPGRIYADVPYVSELGWPSWVTGEPADPHLDVAARFDWLTSLVPEVADGRAGEPVRLDPAQAAAKLEAFRTYRSQFPGIDQGPLRVISNPAIHRFELFWPLAAA